MLKRTRIKVCGITRVHDALLAVHAGVDAIGLVFYQPSARFVTPDQASMIAKAIPPFVSLVGLFVNHEPNYIRDMHHQAKFSLIQFHGNESPEFCIETSRMLSIPFIKAVRVRSVAEIQLALHTYKHAQGLLLDSYKAGQPGGTGMIFNWSLIPKQTQLPIILAGGLASENIEQAISQVKPYAVDVSSGVEQSPGIKSKEKIQLFVEKVYAHSGR